MNPLPTPEPVSCPYCGASAELVGGLALYPHRADLAHKLFYRCWPCDAHCGCHLNSAKPLGRLANAELRRAKQMAHAVFDPLWRGRAGFARSLAYAGLARELGIPGEACHIGMFDVEQCRRVVEACRGKAAARG